MVACACLQEKPRQSPVLRKQQRQEFFMSVTAALISNDVFLVVGGSR